MILYHGTNVDFDSIDLTRSQYGKDFGCGFYLSGIMSQAIEMAKFKARLLGGEVVVQSYEFDENHLHDGSLNYIQFDGYSKEWATFILSNRQNRTSQNIHSYDVIYGPIANDKVGAQIRNVLEQNIDMNTFLRRLKYYKGITYQYFFGSEKAIQLLKRV